MEEFLRLDDTLSDEERAMCDTVRKWVSKEVMPLVTKHYMAGTFPVELVPEIAHLGLLGIKSDPAYGGMGASNTAYGIVCRETERADSGLRSFISVQNSLVIYPIEHFGSEAQKQRWLPALISGKAIGAFGLTDPSSGSDPAGMNAYALPDGKGGYILKGSKQWITNGSIADVVVVWAKSSGGSIRGFLVEKGMPGFTAIDITDKLSMRMSHTATLFFDDVHIPAENLLPTSKTSSAYACLNEARFGIAWGAVGAAEFCYETAREYAGQRKSFGAPIASRQLMQQNLVLMRSEVEDAKLRVARVAALKDLGQATPEHISYIKRNNVAAALRVARMSRAMLGANGITADYHVMRHVQNLETVLTYEGTEEMHLLIEGAGITGIKAFE